MTAQLLANCYHAWQGGAYNSGSIMHADAPLSEEELVYALRKFFQINESDPEISNRLIFVKLKQFLLEKGIEELYINLRRILDEGMVVLHYCVIFSRV